VNEVAVGRERDAKAAPGTLAGTTASAVLPAAMGAPESLSHPRNTPLANLMVSAGPTQALSGMRTPARGPRRP